MRYPHCVTCKHDDPSDFYWCVNPPGGYGRGAAFVCDKCMVTDTWAGYRKQHHIIILADGTCQQLMEWLDEDMDC